MKTKIILLFSVLISACCWMACEDDIDQIGSGIQPGGDKITVIGDSVDITGRTVKVDSIYANSVHGLLGNYSDEEYGNIKAGYLCQFYPSMGFDAKDSIYKNKVDSVKLKIYYATYFGDSLAPMEVTVYPLKTDPLLPEYFFANTTLSGANNFLSSFYDTQKPLGKKAYTARDLTISDSLNLANMDYMKELSISLPRELGQKILEASQADTTLFKSPDNLAKVFPGVAILPTLGSGCLLNVEKTALLMYYTRHYAANDTLVARVAELDMTKEVVQLNNYTGANEDHLYANEPTDNYMYVKTPTGIFSEITIPLSDIKERMKNKKFSNVRLSIEAVPQNEDKKYVLPFPGSTASTTVVASTQAKLLLIEPDSVNGFLQALRVAEQTDYAYTTTFNASKSAYVYNNISTLLQKAMDRGDENLVLYLVPVTTTYSTSSNYYSYGNEDYDTSNYLAPSAVTLKKDNMKIQIIAVSQR